MGTPVTGFEADVVTALPALRLFARSLCHRDSDADDLVQQTAWRALANVHTFEPGTSMNAWLCTILRNEYYSGWRKRRHEVEDEDGHNGLKRRTPPAQEHRVYLGEVSLALDALSPDHKAAILMVGLNGMTYGSAAALSGCAIGTMKSRVNRARERLVEAMG